MKKTIYFTFTICCILTGINFAQWQPDVRLTNDPAVSQTCGNGAWGVASNGNTIHVVWADERNGNSEIYYKRSPDGGVSWGVDKRLTNDPSTSWSASVSVSGSYVHVVWYDERDGNDEIYYKRSTDAGLTWEADTRLSTNPAGSLYPSVSVSGSVVAVVWYDNRESNFEIYCKCSTDGGVSWGAVSRLTNNPTTSEHPSVSVSGSVIHVVWFDEIGSNSEIFYRRSPDGGVSWGVETRLTNASSFSGFPSISVSGSVVHVVWEDNRDGNEEIYYKRSTDGGFNWGADTRLTNYTTDRYLPSVSVSGSNVHLVWYDMRNGNEEIYYKRSLNGGINWGPDTRLTNNSARSNLPSVSVSGSAVHVVWQDDRDGNKEIYYKRDPTGNLVGMKNINSEVPKEFGLSQNYPNPFNPKTVISFTIGIPSGQLAVNSFASLKVYDLIGSEVTTLVNEQLNPGTYEVDFDAANYPSGIYFYTLTTKEYTNTKRMVLIK